MKFNNFLLLTLSFILTSCSSSKISTSYAFQNNALQKDKKIIIVGLIQDKDKTIREKMENHFVGDVAEKGYTVISSYKEYGINSFENLKEDEVINKLKNSGVDIILTIVLLSLEKEKFFVQKKSNKEMGMNKDFWGYYESTSDRILNPEYFKEETKFYWETNLFSLSTKKLLYTAKSNSFTPKNIEILAHDYSKTIVEDLTKKGLLKKLEL